MKYTYIYLLNIICNLYISFAHLQSGRYGFDLVLTASDRAQLLIPMQ